MMEWWLSLKISWYFVLVVAHVFGLVIGLGACTVTYVIGGYGMLKPKIMPSAVGVFKLISVIVWAGLGILIVSGILLLIVSHQTYGDAIKSKLFYLKMFLIVVEIINGLFLNLVVTPAMEKAAKLENFEKTPEYRHAQVIGAVGGFISSTCWYGAFALGMYIFRVVAG